jgi:hypothetical protein
VCDSDVRLDGVEVEVGIQRGWTSLSKVRADVRGVWPMLLGIMDLCVEASVYVVGLQNHMTDNDETPRSSMRRLASRSNCA